MIPLSRVTPSQEPSQVLATEQPQQERFVFLVCQHGAEATIKSRWLADGSPYRLAFSRPGLLTFKIPPASGEHPHLVDPPADWLIRQSGYALGQVRGEQAEHLAQAAIDLAGKDWDVVHVFARDPALPGLKGFEPGPCELTRAIAETFRELLPTAHCGDTECEKGARVLDILLIEPNHWLVGHHLAVEPHQRWPGGALSMARPAEMISRAYLKMGEAIAWSGFALEPGDAVVELGSSPGGSCQRLLDLGLRVTGIDPAQMHPMLMGHPRFTHWRSKASGIKRKYFNEFRWLAADANVAPNYTLDAVEDIVTYPTSRFEGLLLTLKLSSYDLVQHLEGYLDRIRSWGFTRVEVRQLATNRRECCVVAQRELAKAPPRSNRAIKRGRARSVRSARLKRASTEVSLDSASADSAARSNPTPPPPASAASESTS